MKTGIEALVVTALLAAAATGAQAQATRLYDNFLGSEIDGDLWPGQGERLREQRQSRLHLRLRDTGDRNRSDGSTTYNFPTAIRDARELTALRSTLRVDEFETVDCGDSDRPTQVQARLYGTFFNAGQAVSGRSTGDVAALVRLVRRSTDTTPGSELVVEAAVERCRNASCSSVSRIGTAPLGTTTVGTLVTAAIRWDAPRQRFLFRRDGQAEVPIVYRGADSEAPGRPVASLGLRATVPNCGRSSSATGMIEASFTDLYVNPQVDR